jgi:hypothetical protein
MPRVKVRSTMNIIGLKAGQQAEIDLTSQVVALLRSGYLVLLRPKTD